MQILVSGGSGSGKSQLAEQLAVHQKDTTLLFCNHANMGYRV